MDQLILITGGHVTPALALITELKKRGAQRIVFVGRKVAMEGDSALSYEFREVSRLNIPFIPLITGRISRSFSKAGLVSLFKIPLGFLGAFAIILQTRPKIIISFGGYIAFPIVIAGWLTGIPIVTHEQTLRPGLANRITGMIASVVCISWKETGKFFPQKKTVLTGNPLRQDLFESPEKPPVEITSDHPIIFVCGGSLGSHALNTAVGEIIEELSLSYTVVHQVGDSELTKDLAKMRKVRDSLPQTQRKHYHVFPYLTAKEVGWMYRHASLVISRAGANTVTEIAWFGVPSILVPLPWSGSGEQEENAKILVNTGLANVVKQAKLQTKLLTTIKTMIKHVNEYKNQATAARKLVSPEASGLLADVVETIVLNKV